MRFSTILLAAMGLAGALLATPTGVAEAQVAIIVHPGNPVSNFSLDEVRRSFLGEMRAFKNNEPILLIEHPAARASFYRAALGMSEDRVKRYWIGLVFAGEGVAPPKEITDPEALKRFVATHPGAIAFLEQNLVDATVKTLTIKNLPPSDPGYPLPLDRSMP